MYNKRRLKFCFELEACWSPLISFFPFLAALDRIAVHWSCCHRIGYCIMCFFSEKDARAKKDSPTFWVCVPACMLICCSRVLTFKCVCDCNLSFKAATVYLSVLLSCCYNLSRHLQFGIEKLPIHKINILFQWGALYNKKGRTYTPCEK